MDQKIQERLRKLQALAERGVGGEKETAQKKLQQLLEKNSLTLDDLETEKKYYYLFSYNGRHKAKLLRQCMYKVLGAGEDISFYRTHGTRQKIGIECTPGQKLEIELEYEFYSRIFDEEIITFMDAFISKQHIFPEDAPVNTITMEELTPEERKKRMKEKAYAEGITKRTLTKMIEVK